MIPANQLSIVGERGPELFMPKTSGTIIPNNKLSNAGTSQSSYVTYNISAVDAMSFKQTTAVKSLRCRLSVTASWIAVYL